MSVSSVPSKYSTILSVLLKSFKFSVNFSEFPSAGVGVNLSPLFNKLFLNHLSISWIGLLF